jgi:hypothetical protein
VIVDPAVAVVVLAAAGALGALLMWGLLRD